MRRGAGGARRGVGGTRVSAGGVGGGATCVVIAWVVAARLLPPPMPCVETGGVNGYWGGV